MKTVLIIAGSDPGAGAGLQQDLKVTTLLGAYGLTVVTALTVQNSQGVTAVHPVAPEVVAAQLDAVLSDFPVAAVKVGMLATPALVHIVAERLKALDGIPLVLDPVLAAGGGFPLLTADGIAGLTAELFPLTHLLTPNAPEAARLAGIEVRTPKTWQRRPAASRPWDPAGSWPKAATCRGNRWTCSPTATTSTTCLACAWRPRITTVPAASWPQLSLPAWPRAPRCRKR